jgi:hypothetical protein
LLEPHRNFHREGPITLLNVQNQKKTNGFMFLFNDLLVLAKRGLLQGFQLESKLSLVSTTFVASSFHGTGLCERERFVISKGLELTCDDRSYVLLFKSASERDEWMELIMSCKNSLMSKTNKRAKWYLGNKKSTRDTNSRRSSF